MKKIIASLIIVVVALVFFVTRSTDIDMVLGEQNTAMVASEMGIYDDEAKTTYLRNVGMRLVEQLDEPLFDFQFHLVPQLSPNAFALPGGYIYVTTGLLAILQSEDELACIIGHEIIHSNNRHTVQQMKKSVLPKLLEVPGNLIYAFDENLGTIYNTPIKTSNALLFASYGRDFETEADHLGIELAAKAGYDPEAMITSLTRLSNTVEIASGMKESRSYFNDHPHTSDRNMAISKHSKKIKKANKAPISSSYLMEFNHTLFGDDVAQGVIDQNRFIHPALNFSIEFPKKWQIDNQVSNVSAFSPNGQAALILSIVNEKISPKKASEAFIESLNDEYKAKLEGKQPYNVNGQTGYLVSFSDTTEDIAMYAHVYWMQYGNELYQFIGIGPIEYEDILLKSVSSFGSVSEQEMESIYVNYLEMVEAREGEYITTLSKRTGNILSLDLTRVINDKQEKQTLKEGEIIKVVRSYPYKAQ